MIQPTLSIIIVHYKTKDITLDCLKSIFLDKGLEFDLKQSSPSNSKIPTEIIVVDNDSQDDFAQAIKKFPHKINLITNKQNQGFAIANNQGIKQSHGNYILLLNSDTIILHSAISQSLNWLASHPEAYGCTAQLLNADKTIQSSGGYFPNLLNTFAWSIGLDDLPFVNKIIKPLHPHPPTFYTHDSFFLTDHPQDWISGAFMLLRRNVLEKINGFDENYFMYSEELEMCYRIHLAFPQKEAWYLVGPQVIHLGGASSKNIQFSYDREYQGIMKFFKIHKPSLHHQLAGCFIKLNRILRKTIYPLFRHA